MFLVMLRAALQGKHFDCGDELRRQGGDGMRHRNKGEYDSAVHRRAARRCARHVRRGNLGGLVVRPEPRVTEVVVCNPRKAALLKDGSKGDRIDAYKLAELLYMNRVKSVYHGEHGLRTMKELARRAALLGFTRTYKTAGTAKVRASRARHRILWIGLWVGNSPDQGRNCV